MAKGDTYEEIPDHEKEVYLMLHGWEKTTMEGDSRTFWLTPGSDIVDTEYAFFLKKFMYEGENQ